MFGILIFTLPCLAPDTECPSHWLPHGDYCYKFVFDKLGTWFDAFADCRRQGGYLTDIQTIGENDFIFDTLLSHEPESSSYDISIWIAFTNIHLEGIWVWDTPTYTKVQFTKWDHGEPFDYEDQEECAVMWTSDNGVWIARPCGIEENHEWVCKYSTSE